MKNKFNIHFSIRYRSEFQNLYFSKSEAFDMFLNALTFPLNLMSGVRALNILEPMTKILNAFLEVLLYLTLKLSYSTVDTCLVLLLPQFVEH